jgi:hypothetical protein
LRVNENIACKKIINSTKLTKKYYFKTDAKEEQSYNARFKLPGNNNIKLEQTEVREN